MVEAREVQKITNTVYLWSAYDPACKCELFSTALVTPAGLVLIDPIGLSDLAWSELKAVGSPRLILLTNGNHAREAEILRKRWRIPVAATVETKKKLTEFNPEVIISGKELLYGISAHPLTGGSGGESAFLAPGRILILGDSVVRMGPDQALHVLPDKYCDNPAELRSSLASLLDLDFSTLIFAHGHPLIRGAKEQLSALLKPHSV